MVEDWKWIGFGFGKDKGRIKGERDWKGGERYLERERKEGRKEKKKDWGGKREEGVWVGIV